MMTRTGCDTVWTVNEPLMLAADMFPGGTFCPAIYR
jgi:hypothetical protein